MLTLGGHTDDLEIAPDFFDYFLALRPVLHANSNLYCVSAFNDHGDGRWMWRPEEVYLSDFFPGLGWMLTRKMWEQELRPKWPKGVRRFFNILLGWGSFVVPTATPAPQFTLLLCRFLGRLDARASAASGQAVCAS